MLQNLIDTKASNCTCSEENKYKKINKLNKEFIKASNRLFNKIYYEVGSKPTSTEIFSLLLERDLVLSDLNKICTNYIDSLHTEESFLEKCK